MSPTLSPTPNLVAIGLGVMGRAGVKYPSFPLISIDFRCCPQNTLALLWPACDMLTKQFSTEFTHRVVTKCHQVDIKAFLQIIGAWLIQSAVAKHRVNACNVSHLSNENKHMLCVSDF